MTKREIADVFADARVDRICAGTSEIVKPIFGRDLFSQACKSILD